MSDTLTTIPGLRVGHAHDLKSPTGCTVILCPPKTVGGVDQRGGAPGTRETDLLHPMQMVQHVNALFLAGGSAYGLAVGDGVMRYLEEEGSGFAVGPEIIVPIVPGAILFDLGLGSHTKRPTAEMGYTACKNATDAPVVQGSVGAGAGATVGSLLGPAHATKGGIGSAAEAIQDGLYVAALFAVNAFGDVLGEDGQIIAGLRTGPEDAHFADTLVTMRQMAMQGSQNTVVGVVATNARLDKAQTNKLAQMAQAGLTRAVRPAHTPFDGDTIFGLATGTYEAAQEVNIGVLGAFAAEVTSRAIRNAVRHATGLSGVPAAHEL